jgi:hypothetical protein
MLGLIVETFIFGKGVVAAIGLHVRPSSNWLFGIIRQQKLAQMIRETETIFCLLQYRF